MGGERKHRAIFAIRRRETKKKQLSGTTKLV